MRKKLLTSLCLIFACLLSGCVDAALPEESKSVSQPTEESVTITRPIDGIWPTFHFLTVDEITKAFDKSNTECEIQQNKYSNGLKFYRLAEYLSDKSKWKCPYLNGKIFPMGNDPVYPPITVFANDRFEYPWIWYTGNWKDDYINICTLYLDIVEETDLSSAHTASEVIMRIEPNFPNLHNRGQFEDAYTAIYEKNMRISGKDVNVVIYEPKTAKRLYAAFVYDNLLVFLQINANDYESMMLTYDQSFWDMFYFDTLQ